MTQYELFNRNNQRNFLFHESGRINYKSQMNYIKSLVNTIQLDEFKGQNFLTNNILKRTRSKSYNLKIGKKPKITDYLTKIWEIYIRRMNIEDVFKKFPEFNQKTLRN